MVYSHHNKIVFTSETAIFLPKRESVAVRNIFDFILFFGSNIIPDLAQ